MSNTPGFAPQPLPPTSNSPPVSSPLILDASGAPIVGNPSLKVFPNSDGFSYNSYAGADYQIYFLFNRRDRKANTPNVVADFVHVCTLQTISVSSARSLFPVRRIGETYAVGYTSGARCLPETEKVLIRDKGYVRITDVEVGDYVQSDPGSYNKVLGVFDQGTKKCNRLSLGNGYELVASFDHPVSTPNGMVEMAKLHPSDVIDVVGYSPAPDVDAPISDDMIKLIAYLIGDGTTLTYPKESGSIEHRVALSISDKEMSTIGVETEEILRRNNIEFWDHRSRDDKCIARRMSVCLEGHAKTDWRLRKYNELHHWLLELGMYGKYSHQKSVPQWLMSVMSRRQIAIFLSRLFSTDGCYSVSGMGMRYIAAEYTSTSEDLADGVRMLLSKMGIGSIKSKEDKVGKPGGRPDIVSRYDAYHIVISDSLELTRFIRRVGIYAKDYIIKSHNIEEIIINRILRPRLKIGVKEFRDLATEASHRVGLSLRQEHSGLNLSSPKFITPRKALRGARYLGDSQFTSMVLGWIEDLIDGNNDFQPMKVISNVPVGDLRVFDLEVEDRHTFIVNFIKVHNTIAGSLIFTIAARDVFAKVMSYASTETLYGRAVPFFVDQLPEFTVLISATNEYGQTASAAIVGVRLSNFGQTMSVDDIYTESSYSYVARFYFPLIADDPVKFLNGLSSDSKSGHDPVSKYFDDATEMQNLAPYGTLPDSVIKSLRSTYSAQSIDAALRSNKR